MQSKTYSVKTDEKYGYKTIDPQPSIEEVNKFYKEEFYTGEYKQFNDSDKEVQLRDYDYHKIWWKHVWEHSMKDLKSKNRLGNKKINVIDIGCGFGLFLEFIVKNYNVNAFGYDPAPEAIDYLNSKGINGQVGGLENIKLTNTFDVVLLINVLEHLINPEKTINEIRNKLLEKGGVLVIDVPNEYNLLQKTANIKLKLDEWWVAPPGHLNYFNYDSLKKLLELNGFNFISAEASFPLEMFLLFGDNYVKNSDIGGLCHSKRMNFEKTFDELNQFDKLIELYESFAKIGIGRQIRVYASKK